MRPFSQSVQAGGVVVGKYSLNYFKMVLILNFDEFIFRGFC
jgi:hypothetical protein